MANNDMIFFVDIARFVALFLRGIFLYFPFPPFFFTFLVRQFTSTSHSGVTLVPSWGVNLSRLLVDQVLASPTV